MTDESLFLTGFPGFIASRLLQRLAVRTGRFILLVQPTLVERARSEIASIAGETGRSIDDFHILQGDISQPQLALSVEEIELLRSRTTRILHLAAVYDLAVSRELALRVNVEGIRNMNALAQTIPGLRHYHHVSTCYVAGKREGRIFETELEHSAGFRNFYEESKYLAELEVERLKSALPITIHRPAVVCGDSQSGETTKYDGVYYLIHYLLRWPSGLSVFNIGNHVVCLNLVPVDFVVKSIAALTFDERVIGQTLQHADPNPLTTNQLFNAIAKSINGKQSRITLPRRLVYWGLMLPPSPAITHLPHHAVPYFFVKQTYDTSQSQEALQRHGIECPPFESYVSAIVDFAARHPTLRPSDFSL
jgi:thioester reductase-like protein